MFTEGPGRPKSPVDSARVETSVKSLTLPLETE
jgi:hypothetical protein